MGTWGYSVFESDIAVDWTYRLLESGDLNFIRDTLSQVLDKGNDYLDTDPAIEGLAACEAIARLNGNWGLRDVYSENLDAWVEDHNNISTTDLIPMALAVINRIKTPPSELLELWAEDSTEWLNGLNELRLRVEVTKESRFKD